MGQPSATKHLQTLEAAVGEKLVERRGRASGLTEAGEVVAAHATRVLDELEAMQEQLQALGRAERGTLSLAASTTPGSYVLPSILQCFAERRKGGETGVKAVQCLEGDEMWKALDRGAWSKELLEAAISRVPAAVPSVVQSSLPAAAVVCAKNATPPHGTKS